MPFGASAEDEYRAVWIDTWNPAILNDATAKLTIARLRQHNFNTIFLEVCKTMDAYYDSDLLPRATNIETPGFDPLASTLQYARPNNPGLRPLQVHAWVVALRAWKDSALPKGMSPPHVMEARQSWLSKTDRGQNRDEGKNYFLDPGHPEVQDFLVNVMKEIVRKYPVDGLHLDYIRYPGQEWGYNETALRRFQAETGRKDKPHPTDEQWSQWRRDQVTQLVRRISAEIREVRPGVALSVAAITWGDVPAGSFKKSRAYNEALQDWVGWIQEGYVDINVPMIYKRGNNAEQTRDYVDWIKLARGIRDDRHLIVGLGAWLNPLTSTNRQISVARKHGCEGVCFFSFNQLETSDRTPTHVLRDISGSVFTEPVRAPGGPWLHQQREAVVAGTDPKRRGSFPVLLMDPNKRVLAETKTDANGHFHFFNVPRGARLVQVGRASILSKPFEPRPGRVQRVRF